MVNDVVNKRYRLKSKTEENVNVVIRLAVSDDKVAPISLSTFRELQLPIHPKAYYPALVVSVTNEEVMKSIKTFLMV